VRRLLFVLLATAVVAVGLLGCSSGDSDGGRESKGLEGPDNVGDPLPDVTFTRFDGSEGTLADYDGKPLVINWFSTWCAPCVREMPALESVHQKYGDEVAFLGFNNQDTLEDGKALAEAAGVTWDLARDPRGEILAEFGGVAMPTTVLVSEDGHIVATHSGEFKADDLDRLIAEKLLA
jgi:thiol-disulfide isomerase/thioredoxin